MNPKRSLGTVCGMISEGFYNVLLGDDVFNMELHVRCRRLWKLAILASIASTFPYYTARNGIHARPSRLKAVVHELARL